MRPRTIESPEADALREAFGLALRSLRIGRALTQREIGGITGITQSRIARLETGSISCPLEDFCALARALKLSRTELFEHVDRALRTLETAEARTAYRTAKGRTRASALR